MPFGREGTAPFPPLANRCPRFQQPCADPQLETRGSYTKSWGECAEGDVRGAASSQSCGQRGSAASTCSTLQALPPAAGMAPLPFLDSKTNSSWHSVKFHFFFNYCMICGGISLKETSLPMFLYPPSSLFARKTVGTIGGPKGCLLSNVSSHAFYKCRTTSFSSWLWLISGF